MSKNHSFNIDDAVKYGVNQAILLSNFRHWLDYHKANKTNIHDGFVWMYNSSKSFSELFPYMKASSIRRWLKELEEEGLIKSGNYNKSPYDKTKWYTIPSEYKVRLTKMVNQCNKMSNQREEIEHPIPDITTDINTNESKDTHPNPLVEQERAKARKYKKELEGRISFTESDNPEKDLKQLIESEYIKSLEKLGRWRELASDDKKQFLSDFCLKKAFTPFNDRNHLLNTLTVWLANYKSYKSYKPTVQAEEPRKKLNYV